MDNIAMNGVPRTIIGKPEFAKETIGKRKGKRIMNLYLSLVT